MPRVRRAARLCGCRCPHERARKDLGRKRRSAPRTVDFRAGVDLRPGSSEQVPSPDGEQFSAANDRLRTAIEQYSAKGPGFGQARKRIFEKLLGNWLQLAETWVAEDPAARAGWAESWLWYCEAKIYDDDDFTPQSLEAWTARWEGLFPIWSEHASEAHREGRRHTKWRLWPCQPGNYSLYVTGFGRGVIPENQPVVRRLLSQYFGWDLESADALISRALHIEPQLVASGISEEAAITYKSHLDPAIRMKIKSGATAGRTVDGKRSLSTCAMRSGDEIKATAWTVAPKSVSSSTTSSRSARAGRTQPATSNFAARFATAPSRRESSWTPRDMIASLRV